MVRHYSDETKAAVMAALLEGQSVNSVAKKYDLPKGTVSGWKHQAQRVAQVSTQKKEEIGDKLVVLLNTQIDTLIGMYDTICDPDWIKKQSAADMAVLMGVTQDKLIRMLEAFGHSNDSS